jgi:DNA-binding MarR family transcriptional regulator
MVAIIVYATTFEGFQIMHTDMEQALTPAELAAWKGFLHTHHALVARLDAQLVERHRLPLTSYEVLLQLANGPGTGIRMSDVADRVLLSRSGLTRLVDRLERDGLVERRSCPSDARGQLALLTERGRAAFEEARRTHLDGVRREFLDRFDAEELEQLAALWSRFGDPDADGGAC